MKRKGSQPIGQSFFEFIEIIDWNNALDVAIFIDSLIAVLLIFKLTIFEQCMAKITFKPFYLTIKVIFLSDSYLMF